LNSDFEIQQHLGSLKHVINIIIWIRDMGCYTFIIKIPIGCHMVAKTLIDSGASLNLMMRKSFNEMGLNLDDMTPCMTLSMGSS
jgi:hypothetical protein